MSIQGRSQDFVKGGGERVGAKRSNYGHDPLMLGVSNLSLTLTA